MDLNVEVVEPKLYAGVVADEIVASINDAISERGRCTLSLAGGNTPSVIYRTLAKPPRVGEVEWDKVDIFWGDERWVPKEDHLSNYKMAHETLLSHITGPKPSVYPVDTSLSSPEIGAAAYADCIRRVMNVPAGESPEFDVVLLGVGEDGHTASLFPGCSLLSQDRPDPICASTVHPGSEGSRITLTPRSIYRARRIIFIVTGVSKAPVVRKVIEGSPGAEEIPASLFRRSSGKVSWFLDSPAAQGLRG